MDGVKKHFDDMADDFDARVLKTVPFYIDMLEALVSALPFDKERKISVVDLGCGTGTISKKVKEYYPNALITCVDFSDKMIRVAKRKLENYTGINYVTCDCKDFDCSAGYDAVVSSLALHHIRDEEEKKDFYKRIFAGLNRDGVFYNADLVLGASDYLQNLNMEKWKEFLLQSVSLEEILKRKRNYEKEDHPFKLIDEIRWLEEADFSDIEIVWKYYHFAVYGGGKR